MLVKVPRIVQRQALGISVNSTANQSLPKGALLSVVYCMIYTSSSVAVELPVVVGLCAFLIPVHMRCGDVAPLCAAAAVLLHNRC